MTLILNQSDWDELYEQSPPLPPNITLNEHEQLVGIPKILGRGVRRGMELSHGISLTLADYECSQDWMFEESAHPHPIQLVICLSGWIHGNLHPSAASQLNFRVNRSEFTARIVDFHLPIYTSLSAVDIG
jgi:hypothetical protein